MSPSRVCRTLHAVYFGECDQSWDQGAELTFESNTSNESQTSSIFTSNNRFLYSSQFTHTHREDTPDFPLALPPGFFFLKNRFETELVQKLRRESMFLLMSAPPINFLRKRTELSERKTGDIRGFNERILLFLELTKKCARTTSETVDELFFFEIQIQTRTPRQLWFNRKITSNLFAFFKSAFLPVDNKNDTHFEEMSVS